MDHVPSHLPRILDPEDDPDLEPHQQGLWDPLAGKLKMKLDSGEQDLVDGETSAVGAIAGQPVIPGTVGTVRFVDQARKPVSLRTTEKEHTDVGQSSSDNARVNSLLLAKGTFTIEAASREDGSDEASLLDDASSFVQIGQGPDKHSIHDQLLYGADLRELHQLEAAKQATQQMHLDGMEASMVAREAADEVGDTASAKDTETALDKDTLPDFPMKEYKANRGCQDESYTYICARHKTKGECRDPAIAKSCLKTCNRCGRETAKLDVLSLAAPPKSRKPGDCVVSKWEWSTCTDQQDGTMAASRKVLQKPIATGVPCPALTVKVRCNSGACHPSCKTCRGSTSTDCVTCYDSRESVLNAPKLTNDKNETQAWKPATRRANLLAGEAGYQFKMLSLRRMTGQCVWEEDIVTKETISTDGNIKCTHGCDPPSLLGTYTPGYVCTKKCTQSEWGFHDLPKMGTAMPVSTNSNSSNKSIASTAGKKPTSFLLGEAGSTVLTGKAAKPTCTTTKTISCSPVREVDSKAEFSGDSKRKCTVRKSARCLGMVYGTYILHKASKSLPLAKLIFIQREYSTEIATTCKFDTAVGQYKGCKLTSQKISEADAFLAKQSNPSNSDDSMITSLMQKAYKAGWVQLVLNDGFFYFAKFQSDPEDTSTYGCLSNDACQQIATLQ